MKMPAMVTLWSALSNFISDEEGGNCIVTETSELL